MFQGTQKLRHIRDDTNIPLEDLQSSVNKGVSNRVIQTSVKNSTFFMIEHLIKPEKN